MDRSNAKPRPEGKPKREVIYIAQANKQKRMGGGGFFLRLLQMQMRVK